MQIFLKLTIPDKILTDIDKAALKLWPEITWWDLLFQTFEQTAKVYRGDLKFVKVRKEGSWVRRLLRRGNHENFRSLDPAG